MRVELKHISKTFGRVKANYDISLTFEPGRIYAILGENGAGKSTLMKIMSGYQSADSGDVVVDDQVLQLDAPTDAIEHGIGMLYQDPLDFPPFTVLENFIAGRPGSVFPDREAARQQLLALTERFGFNLDPNAYVDSLTIGERQQLEILRLLSLNVRVLVMDEPTTGISAEQKNALFNVLKSLAHDDGLSIILVSHKLEDVIELCNEAFVLRRGQLVGHQEIPCRVDELVALMFGKVLARQERQPVRFTTEADRVAPPAPSQWLSRVDMFGLTCAAILLLAFVLLPWIGTQSGHTSGLSLLLDGPNAELMQPALVQADSLDKSQTYLLKLQDGWQVSAVQYAVDFHVRKAGQTRPIIEKDEQWIIVKDGTEWKIVDPNGDPVSGWTLDAVKLLPTADDNIQIASFAFWDTTPLSQVDGLWTLPKEAGQSLQSISFQHPQVADPILFPVVPHNLWYQKEVGLEAYQPTPMGTGWYLALWIIPLIALGSIALTLWNRRHPLKLANWGQSILVIAAEIYLLAFFIYFTGLGATTDFSQIGLGYWIAFLALFGMIFPLDFRRAAQTIDIPYIPQGTKVTALSARNISVASRRLTVEDVSLDACNSEVIGLAGLDGSGQGEFIRVCTGLLPPFGGSVQVDSRTMTGHSYHQYVEAGVAFLPAGRLEEGLIGGMTLTQHLALTLPTQLELNWFRLSPFSAAYIAIRNWQHARTITAERIKRFNVKGRPGSPIQTLSGGNQQRFALALLPANLRLLLLEHPTRGLDVESALYIWEQLLKRRADGTAIVFISAELDEIVAYSDRILVFFGGRVTTVDQAEDMTADYLGKLIGGYA
ncbi:MAG TPA: ATP-binding cassette domain-containing protein [Aggregatilineaceae bacterium]|nr:ATP-binding cassette domain-containing protein [Aggregatilineaceae bacterium]